MRRHTILLKYEVDVKMSHVVVLRAVKYCHDTEFFDRIFNLAGLLYPPLFTDHSVQE